MEQMKVKLVNEYAQLPTRGSKDAAGLDLYCPFHIKVPADSQKKIPLGIAVEIPQGYMGLLALRSSMSKTPLRCANSVGIIDADYRGELSIAYENISCSDYTIFRGDRIAQLIIVPIAIVDVEEAQTLSETERGAGGYGSTGK
ncbi:MAG: dUTP diphosphatase [Veillonella sp.]|uniref:dUTP diphosphatase n=1 Tax=Veillonella sp. TaxID=1926307 RepID=UPI002914D301|nr:dUTP diphosphatase [Veillonella sp.]MDU3705499.1 dUTP diphosphatase [Veillonella sp.]